MLQPINYYLYFFSTVQTCVIIILTYAPRVCASPQSSGLVHHGLRLFWTEAVMAVAKGTTTRTTTTTNTRTRIRGFMLSSGTSGIGCVGKQLMMSSPLSPFLLTHLSLGGIKRRKKPMTTTLRRTRLVRPPPACVRETTCTCTYKVLINSFAVAAFLPAESHTAIIR